MHHLSDTPKITDMLPNVSFAKKVVSLFCTLACALAVTAQPSQKSGQIQSIERNSLDNTPQNISFSPSSTLKPQDVQTIFEQYSGVAKPGVSIQLSNSTTTKQKTVVDRYFQFFKGIKIEYSSFTLMSKDNAVSFVTSNIYNADPALSTVPALSESAALAKAMAKVGAEKYMWQDPEMESFLKKESNDPKATFYPKGELVWIEDMEGTEKSRKLHLAYKFNVYAQQPLSRDILYVDAKTGKILFLNPLIHHTAAAAGTKYSGTINIQTGFTGGNYKLTDSTRGGGVRTFNLNHGSNYSAATHFTNATTTWPADTSIDAHWGAEKTYDYWLNEQGRNSFNGSGAVINSYVHYSTAYDNAFWDGSRMTYGDGSGVSGGGLDPLVCLDVVAHEIGHAVCQYTANLVYASESGAMNEGFSDIWGAVIENYANPFETDAKAKNRWLIGEEISSSQLRSMQNPNTNGDPDTHSGTNWVTVIGCTPTSSNDYCGVHTNSGVLNHWFYRMVEGGSGTNDLGNAFNVYGIGMSDAADIAYQTELVLTSTATYANCRTASISVATTLYGACSPQVQAVTAAWYAVGVGANFTPCTTWIGFSTSTSTVTENASTTSCPATRNITIPVNVFGITPGGAMTVSVTASGGTATGGGVDYTLNTTSLTFASGSTASQNISITINDNGAIVDTKNIILSLAVTSGGSIGSIFGPLGTMNLTIENNDAAPRTTSSTAIVNVNSVTHTMSGGSPFASGVVMAQQQYLVRASELTASSVSSAIPITSLAFFVSTKNSTAPFSNFTIKMAHTTDTNMNTGFRSPTFTTVYTGSVTTTTGWNTLNFGTNFTWDGTSNILINVCFNNASAGTANDVIYAFVGTYNSSAYVQASSGTPCALSASFVSSGKPIMQFGQTTPPTSPESTASISRSWNVRTGQEVYFYNNSNGNLIAQLKNPSANLGCVTASVSTAGTGFTASSFDGSVNRSRKEYTITPTTGASASYTAGIYLTSAELAGTSPSSLKILKTNESTDATINRLNSQLVTPTVVSWSTHSGFVGNFNSFSRFFLVNGSVLPSVAALTPTSGSVCGGGSVTLTGSPTGSGYTYQWLLSGSPISGATNSTYAATTAGSYRIVISNPATSGIDTSGTATISGSSVSISGASSLCSGTATTLSATTGGGTWTSSNTSVATIGASSGVLSGVGSGTATISYTVAGCSATRTVTVNATPGSITGGLTVCAGSTTSLSNATSGGVWSSSNTIVATVNSSTGVAIGVASGTSTISYTMPSGCRVVATLAVNPNPSAISGATSLCAGSTTTWSNASGGGFWTSSATSVATMGITSGILSGVSAGSATISYTLATGCFTTRTVTISALPGGISGPSSVCIGNSVTFSNSVGGGVWTSSSTSIASIGSSSGISVGLSAGAVSIIYTLSGVCSTSTALTVNTSPASIAGVTTTSTGGTTTLSSSTAGGTWTSSNTAVASVGATFGIVRGIGGGTATISYTLASGCHVTTIVTVSGTSAISGVTTLCAGTTSTLSNTSGGGTWISTNTSVATIGLTSGVVSGVSAGTATIRYFSTFGDSVQTIVTIQPLPGAISGGTVLCAGSTTTLTSSTAGGAWTSGSTGVATINSTSGVLSGITSGTSSITYTLPTGCRTATIITVSPLPASISGASSVCVGATTTWSNATGGGVWNSANTAVATIGLTSGAVGGVAAGNTVISYTLPTGCLITKTITVIPLPSAIGGTLSVCVGGTTTLSNATTGGTWASSNLAIAIIGSSSGIASGLTAGATSVIYTAPTGCTIAATLTVNSSPAAIGGSTSVTAGATITLTNSTAGGTWSSGNTSVATIVSGSGILRGVAGGTSTITYTLASGCFTTTIITVNGTSAIFGSTTMCAGSTSTLSNSVSGGTWISTNSSVATIGLTSGIVSGVSAGTATIRYYSTFGDSVQTVVTINPLPGAISGTSLLCLGNTATLTTSTTGGVWISGSTGVATISSSTGILSGVSAGTSAITYTLPTGCYATTLVTIAPNPAAITGAASVCVGATTTWNNSSSGGVWSSGNTAVATIGLTSGAVGGVAAGNTLISYTLPTGCFVTKSVTVLPVPGSISGTLALCSGTATTLSNSMTGGSWSSSNTGIASINATSGVLSAISGGVVTVSYSTSCGAATASVTVTPTPSGITISGSSSVAVGAAITLSSATVGGTWNSSNANATVDTVGIVAGITAGNSIISYTVTNSCGTAIATKTITIFTPTGGISGTTTFCAGSSSLLTSSPSGGTWSSSNTGVATVDPTSGLVDGISAGTATISYITSGGTTTAVITILALPAPISGSTSVCVGTSTTLTNTTTGGIWSSSDPAVATIDPTGVVTALTAGTASITYATTAGCSRSVLFTVYPAPGAIIGGGAVCLGSTITLSNSATGGTWSSSNPGIAAVDATSGVVSGVSASSFAPTITYTAPGGCAAFTTVTVVSLAAVYGPGSVCAGNTITMTNATSGGSWSSSDVAIASIGSTGIVTALSAGTTTISYSLSSGCLRTTTITVHAGAGTISGLSTVCLGQSITLSSTSLGGTWASSNSVIAVVGSSTGIVTGNLATSVPAYITYTMPGGCFTTHSVIVTNIAAITGPTSVCNGQSITLANSTAGGSWSSSDATTAAVSTTGVVTTVNPGVVVISYSLGCVRTTTVTVLASPTSISGPSSVCVGQTITLTNGVTGGVWSSSFPTLATVGSASGIVYGVSSSATIPTISYTLAGGCRTTTTVSVGTMGNITGTTAVCTGQTVTLANSTSGGTWSAASASIATVGTSGVVSGVSAGTTHITYAIPSGCFRAVVVMVNATPSAISGAGVICLGTSITLSNSVPGGVWSSNIPTVANVGSTGIVTGISASSMIPTISYTMPGSCRATATVTVYALPGSISGSTTVCSGAVTTLGSATAGGTWATLSSAIATVGPTGIVSGVAAGTTVATYTAATGCFRTAVITVNPGTSPILGSGTICVGQSVSLSTSASGGTWTSSNNTIASVNATSGVLTGVSASSVRPTITYTLAGGCRVTTTVLVVSIANITGLTNVCAGQTITLGNTTAGGVWSSGNTSVATIGTTGIVSGVSAGVSVITYGIPGGCSRTTTITVGAAPGAIFGAGALCYGSTITLTNATSGGTWTSSHPTTVSVGAATGIAVALAASSTIPTITYTLPGGCAATATVSVVYMASILGPSSVCEGRTITLGNSAAGGTWSSTATGVASISPTAVVTAIAAGTTVISYAIGTTCSATRTITVHPSAVISGPSSVCNGLSVSLTGSVSGGTWSSYYGFIASVNVTSGVVTGVSPSSVPSTITYTMPGGCFDTALMYVHYFSPISGPGNVCEGNTINLSNSITGGTWSSSNASIATIGLTSALVSGVSAGNATISYILPSGCTAIYGTTVLPAPGPISGPSNVCVGLTVTLSSTTAGGTWSRYYPSATIGSASGIVTGVSASSVANTITYTLANGCRDTALILVDACARPNATFNPATTTEFSIIPNPNNGTFSVIGTIANANDETVAIEVNNMLGQTVYQSVLEVKNGQLNQSISLGSGIANGTYLVRLRTGSELKIIPIVVAE